MEFIDEEYEEIKANFLKLRALFETEADDEDVLAHIETADISRRTYAEVSGEVTCPLLDAIFWGRLNIVKNLIDLEFSPHFPYRKVSFGSLQECFPINEACKSGRPDIVEYLAEEHFIDVNLVQDGETPLCHAIEYPEQETGFQITKILIEKFADPDLKDLGCTNTALHVAVECRNIKVVKYLLSETHVDVNAKDDSGLTPLFFAVENADIVTCHLLVDSGADVNAKADDGTTPLHTATMGYEFEFVQFLVSMGADPEATDENGVTSFFNTLWTFWIPNYRMAYYFVVDLNVRLDLRDIMSCTLFEQALRNFRQCPLRLTSGQLGIFDLFFVSGYDLGQDRFIFDDCTDDVPNVKIFIKHLREEASQPRTLQQLACFCIRRTLGRGLSKTVDSLPVPDKIKAFVKLEHVHVPGQEDWQDN